MASTILKPLAQALVDLGDGLTLTNGVAVTGYLWERKEIDSLPAVVVEPPDGARTALDEGERELGSVDWFEEYDVSLYVDLDNPDVAQEQMVELLELFVDAVDGGYPLGSALVDDCKVTRWEKFTRLTGNKRLLAGYLCTVAVHHRVADI